MQLLLGRRRERIVEVLRGFDSGQRQSSASETPRVAVLVLVLVGAKLAGDGQRREGGVRVSAEPGSVLWSGVPGIVACEEEMKN